MGLKIATCISRIRAILIGQLRHHAPPLGGPFEMTEIWRATELERQGKIKILKVEDYKGEPFTHSRRIGQVTPNTQKNSIPAKPPGKKPDRSSKVTTTWSPEKIRERHLAIKEPTPLPEPVVDEEESYIHPTPIEEKTEVTPTLETPLETNSEIPRGGCRCPVEGCGKVLARVSGLQMHLRWHEKQKKLGLEK